MEGGRSAKPVTRATSEVLPVFEAGVVALMAKDKSTGASVLWPLQHDRNRGIVGINLTKSFDFQPVCIGHEDSLFYNEADYRDWGGRVLDEEDDDGNRIVPNDNIDRKECRRYGFPSRNPIGCESIKDFLLDEGPKIVYTPPSGKIELLLGAPDFGVSFYSGAARGTSWANGDDVQERESDATHGPDGVKVLEMGPNDTCYDYGIVDGQEPKEDDEPDVFYGVPDFVERVEDRTLFTPVYWYEERNRGVSVATEGERYTIALWKNVRLAYYAVPEVVLARALGAARERGGQEPHKRAREDA